MATEKSTSTLPPDIVPTLPQDILRYVSKVHTFDSFGRAIVESALKQSARRQSSSGAMQATVTITPLGDTDEVKGGAGKAGSAGSSGCISIMIAIGDGDAHFYQMCF